MYYTANDWYKGVDRKMDFFVFVTLLTPKAADSVIGGLVRRNFEVQLATTEYNPAQLLALMVDDNRDEHVTTEESLSGMEQALKDVLAEASAKYHSYVIVEDTGSNVEWGRGNLDADLIQEAAPKTIFDHVTD